MVKITEVTGGSRADRHGVRAGDFLCTVNGREITDVLDYRFFLADTEVRLGLMRDGSPLEIVIHKREYDDIGLDFETPLMDRKHSCENKCIFCFIDQLPAGMRKTLYFKDDDSRLSFLHGNFVTLTNLHDADIQRIMEMHISPINVSVHTTNPELRVKMMHNKRAGLVLEYLPRLAAAGITLCGQIVLCRGINDGAELDRSMRDLFALGDALESVSIVPAGLTRYRQKLFPLEPYTAAEAGRIIDQVDAFAAGCRAACGSRKFFCADELYLTAGRPLPGEEYYEEFAQLENGVGMMTLLQHDFALALQEALAQGVQPAAREATIATGVLAYPMMCDFAQRVQQHFPQVRVRVKKIINDFFGHTITVAGLITGQDLIAQLKGEAIGQQLLIPANMLRHEQDKFLDDVTPQQVEEALGVPVVPVENDGFALLDAMLGM